MTIRTILLALMAVGILASCSANRNAATATDAIPATASSVALGVNRDKLAMGSPLPRARIYRTSVPSDSLVPITLSPSGAEVTSFPAPFDLTQAPLPLADGWLLDRRGISPSTVFTTYTYDEYRSLPDAPTPATLRGSVRPDVTVTDIVELPMPIGEGTADEINALIKAGLPGCRTILKR